MSSLAYNAVRLCFFFIFAFLCSANLTAEFTPYEMRTLGNFSSGSIERKLFFLVLGYDKFHNGHIWNLFFKDVDERKYQVLMHVKNLPAFHPTGFEHKITFVNQRWNLYFKLVYPANELFVTALHYSRNDLDVFFIISSDALPVKPFNEIYHSFSKPFNSHQCYSPTNEWFKISSSAYIPKTHFWSIMNKTDVQKIASASFKYPNYFDIFSPYLEDALKMHCWEEFYYPSAINKETLGATFDPMNSSKWGLTFPSGKIQGSCPMFVWWVDYPDGSPFVSEGIPRLTTRETKGAQMIVITPETLLRQLRKSSNFYFLRKMRGDIPTNFVELANGTHITLLQGIVYVGLYDP